MFAAPSGKSLFNTDSEKCHCHVECLLEPPRRPVTSVARSASVAAASRQPCDEPIATRSNSTTVAGSRIHGIASNLRARSTASVKYVGNNVGHKGHDVSNCSEDNVERLHDAKDDFPVSDGDVIKQTDDNCSANNVDALNQTAEDSLPPAGMDTSVRDSDDDDSDSFSDSNTDDAEWNPKKPVHRARAKRIKPCLRFRLKTDPQLDSELNAIRNDDDVGCGVATVCESKSAVDNKRGHKTGLARKSLTSKLKRVGPKKSHIQTDAKNRVHSVRTKGGPKWEKKVTIIGLLDSA